MARLGRQSSGLFGGHIIGNLPRGIKIDQARSRSPKRSPSIVPPGARPEAPPTLIALSAEPSAPTQSQVLTETTTPAG